MERLVGGDGIVRVLAIPQGDQFRLAFVDVPRIHPFAPETVVDLRPGIYHGTRSYPFDQPDGWLSMRAAQADLVMCGLCQHAQDRQ